MDRVMSQPTSSNGFALKAKLSAKHAVKAEQITLASINQQTRRLLRARALAMLPGAQRLVAPEAIAADPLAAVLAERLTQGRSGLVEGVDGHLEVHDCMGCVLQVEGRAWGVLTLDALQTGTFGEAARAALDALIEWTGRQPGRGQAPR